MIRDWVLDLLTLTDKDWGHYAFSREPLAGRIAEDEQVEFIEKSQTCGMEMAQNLLSKYKGMDPEQVAAQMGVKLQYKNADVGSVYTMFACYEEPDTITIFLDNANATDALLKDEELCDLVGNVKTSDLLTAHELYHYLEQTIPGVYTVQKHITLWKFWRFESSNRIACLEEIGAMAFARELTGLKCSPYLFDVLMLYPKNPQGAKELYDSFMSFKAK